MLNEKFVYVSNYLKISKAAHKSIPHHNEMKKPYWRQLPTSKSLLP